MIPVVFISSTIKDLRHLREQVGEAVSDLEYLPVLSENGDVGYLPTHSAVESCFIEVKHCQIAVIIIGKSYGHILDNGLSVTHMEFRAAREQQIPVITLVEHDVLSLKEVYETNKSRGTVVIPGMDNPEKTFLFLQEIMDSPVNNGIQSFLQVSDARKKLKKQLAHLFAHLLRRRMALLNEDVTRETEAGVLQHAAEKVAGPDTFVNMLKRTIENKGRPLLVVVLEGAREIILTPQELYIEFAPEAKHLRDILAKQDNFVFLKTICRELLNGDINIRISVKEQGESDSEKEQLRRRAEQHPVIQQLLKAFRAEIVDVRRVGEQ